MKRAPPKRSPGEEETDYLPRNTLSQVCGIQLPFMPEVETSSQATISEAITAPVQMVLVFR